jgi:hypothetical protein
MYMYMDSKALWDTQYILCVERIIPVWRNAFSAATTRGLISVCKGCKPTSTIHHFYSLIHSFTHSLIHTSWFLVILYSTVHYSTVQLCSVWASLDWASLKRHTCPALSHSADNTHYTTTPLHPFITCQLPVHWYQSSRMSFINDLVRHSLIPPPTHSLTQPLTFPLFYVCVAGKSRMQCGRHHEQ